MACAILRISQKTRSLREKKVRKTFQSHRCGLISMIVIARRSFQFNKRSQLFIRTHNETLSVAGDAISNPVKNRLFRRLRREIS